MDQLRSKVAKLASSYPEESPQRKKLMRVLASSKDTFFTQSGKPFTMKVTDFARWLTAAGIKAGGPMGAYLRDEERIPDSWVDSPMSVGGPWRNESLTLKQMGATGRAIPRERSTRGPAAKRGPDIQKLWDKFVAAVWKYDAKPDPESAADHFANMPSHYSNDQAEQYFASMSGDIAQSFEWALGRQSEALWDKISMALSSGLFQKKDTFERWDKASVKDRARDVFADAWHTGIIEGWALVQKDRARMAELEALRAR